MILGFMKAIYKVYIFFIVMFFAVSCSTTRVLQDNEYRLAKNRIYVNDKNFDESLLEPYLKQKPNNYFIFGWNPFLNVYNWQNGKGKGWDKFVKKIGVAPVVYDSEMVESSITSMKNHLKYMGYYDSKITSRIRVRKKRVYVDYSVELGKRYPIKELKIELPDNEEFAEAFYADTSAMLVKKGQYLSEEVLEKESQRVATELKDRGYFTMNKNNLFFEADTLMHRDSAVLYMRINEYTRNESPEDAIPFRKFNINKVSISYPENIKIRDKVLTSLNTIRPGMEYDLSNIQNSYRRLSSLRMFNSVNIGMTAVDTNLVDCNISLSQSKLQGFKVGLEASINSNMLFGISPQLSYYHKNIFRGGEWLNVSFMGNFQIKFKDTVRSNEFGFSAGLSFPEFFPLPTRIFTGAIPRTDINIAYNYQNRPEYTRNIISTSYGWRGDVGQKFFYQAYPLQLNVVRLSNLQENFYDSLANDPFLRNAYQNHFDLGCGANLYYTTSTAAIPTKTYWYTRLQFNLAGNLLSAFKPLMEKDANGAGMIWNTPFSQFVRAEWTIGRTWVFGRKGGQSIATRFLMGAGYAYGNSSALPFEQHFYAGGANSLRGWQARTVGPGTSLLDDSFVIPNQTGDMRIEANVEYRFKMFWKFAGAVFLDAGNIWTLKSDGTEMGDRSAITIKNFAPAIAFNWGVGLRLDLSFLLLRLDWGFRIHDPASPDKWVHPRDWINLKGSAFHFGVGYPF